MGNPEIPKIDSNKGHYNLQTKYQGLKMSQYLPQKSRKFLNQNSS